MKILSEKIARNTTVNQLVLPTAADEQVVAPSGKNIIFNIDVSGSMYGELAQIRTQLKNKIPTLVGELDTITLIAFSGRNEAVVVKEGVQVNNLVQLKSMNDAIDRYLRPTGLTAFAPPLELTRTVISNLKGNGNPTALIFLSDGYNNDSKWNDVAELLDALNEEVGSATFIEYGYYADSHALSTMAEMVGGEKIFAKDFEDYEVSFANALGKQSAPKKFINIKDIKEKIRYQFMFSIDPVTQSIAVYSTRGTMDEIMVPENVTELYFLSRYKIDSNDTKLDRTALLLAAFVTADKMKYTAVEDILCYLGDVELLQLFEGAFGKQKLNELKDIVRAKGFDKSLLFNHGVQEGYKIDPKRFCVMDLVELLQSDDGNRLLPFHPDFNYQRIGRKAVTKVELTEEAKAQLATAKTARQVGEIMSQVEEAAEFIYPDNVEELSFSFSTLVWNEKRANLSVQCCIPGKVKLPANDFGLTEVDSFIYRNYTLIKDGILNVTELPVQLTEEVANTLFEKQLLVRGDKNSQGVMIHLLDIKPLPIINRSMTVNVSGKKLAKLELDLLVTQAAQKYLKTLKAVYDKKSNTVSAAKYSPEIAEWLKSIGVDDSNGFSPKRELLEGGDQYVAPHLETKISSFSSLPSINAVYKKLDENIAAENALKADPKAKAKVKSLTPSESLIKAEMDELNPVLYTEPFEYEKRDTLPISVETLNKMLSSYDFNRKRLLYQIAQIKFGVILSRTWFTEFESMEENTLDTSLDVLKLPLKVTFDFSDKVVKV